MGITEPEWRIWHAFELSTKVWLTPGDIHSLIPGTRAKIKARIAGLVRAGALVEEPDIPIYRRATAEESPFVHHMLEADKAFRSRAPVDQPVVIHRERPDSFSAIADPASPEFDLSTTMELLETQPDWLTREELMKLVQFLYAEKLGKSWPYTTNVVKQRPAWKKKESRSNPDWSPPPKKPPRNILG